jgi:hypothetical protein
VNRFASSASVFGVGSNRYVGVPCRSAAHKAATAIGIEII